MEEFIGNHVKFIATWGQLLMFLMFTLLVACLYFLGRRHRYYLPKGVGGWLAGIVCFLLMIVSALIFARITKVKPGVQIIINQLENLKGKPHPPLTFRLVSDSSLHSIEEYKGKVVLLNYWATWCAPCVKEIPELNRLQKTSGTGELVVLLISDERRDRLVKYAKKVPFSAVSGYVTTFDWVNLGSERPATFLVDKQGVIQEYFTGPYDYDFFKSAVAEYK